MFGFEKDKTDTEKESPSNPWGSQLADALADVRKAGVGSKKRAERDKQDGQDSGSRSSISQQDAERLAKMFHPEKWRPIVKAPFAIMKAKTGRDCWTPTESEVDTLAETSSATAEHFLHVDPKWMILTLFVFNWSVVIGDKMAKNAKEAEAENLLKPKVSPVMVRS